jgi:GNAT superfamily N-acetyltransferase
MTITYQTDTDGVDWAAMRQALIDDHFHNGRTVEQYRVSFENSAHSVIAYDGERIIGTARMLSDGVCNAYIVDVWTESAYRRQGIAREMLAILESRAAGQHVSLWTDDMQAFYEACDYRVNPANTLYEKVVGRWLDNTRE